MDLTFVSVIYKPNWERTGKIVGDVLMSLEQTDLPGEYLIVDNSPTLTREACDLADKDSRVRVLWNHGYNTYLAGAITRAAECAAGKSLVYCCASHGVTNHFSWITDIIEPLQDERVALAGCVMPCEFNRVAECQADIINPQIHVQGGVWSARTEFIRSFGLSHRFPFEFCDVDLSRRAIAAGYRLADVSSICSLPSGIVSNPAKYKYIHDYK